MKKLLGLTLGIMTALGGFVDFGQIVFTMQAGALFGNRLLWAVALGTVAIIIYMEMCGRVAVVDVDRPISRHGTPASLLKCEMGARGFRERGVQRLDGDETYVAVFDVPPHPTPPGQIKVCRPTK